MRSKNNLLTILVVALLAMGGLPLLWVTPAAADTAAGVSDGADWSAFGRSHREDRFSPLDQINSTNVSKLGLAWFQDVDTFDSFTAPLAVGGVLYFALGNSVVHAMDARSGKLLWKYDPEVWKYARHKMRAGWGVRGIAYKNGKVFTGTRDGRLIAIDAANGEMLWSVQTLDPDNDAYITGPPWIAGDKVVIGFGGADYAPVRGYVTAYRIDTGERAWRFYVVPGNPADGFEDAAMEMAAKTWTGEWWKFGGAGGTVWNAMAYDEELDRLYIGTGNGAPWNRKIRSPGGGDNLFLASIVALDADTGRYVWHYQQNPGETWDFNATMDIVLADLMLGGERVPVLMQAPKNGFYYVIDRRNGRLISAEKFAKATWAERIDLETGRPVESRDVRYPDGKTAVIFPWPQGAHGVQTMSYNPRTGLAYIPAMEAARVFVDPPQLSQWQYRSGVFVNTGLGPPPASIQLPPPKSFLLAWDPVKQRAAWSVPQQGVLNGGTITTAGNLVFQGLNTGEFVAFAADGGKRLWAFDAQNGILGNAITYLVDGRQYVTVITGYRSSYGSIPPNWDYRTQKRRVLTFALDGKAALPPSQKIDLPLVDDPGFKIDAAKAARGAPIYNSGCTICHGAAARAGGAAPDLRKSPIPLDADAFRAVVRQGALMARGMPSYTQLDDDELEGLRHLIRQWAREANVAGASAAK